MTDLEKRLQQDLEPILELPDPRPKLSAYHDMPYAIFRYDEDDEFQLRRQVTLLETRLRNKGKVVRRVSLAECLDAAMRAEHTPAQWFEVEREIGVEAVVETINHVLASGKMNLIDLVASQLPDDGDPFRDVVFILRTGALFPTYRTFSLLEQLKGRVQVPTVLFYPGRLEGVAGLRFMGVLDAEHNYRAKIF